MAELIIHIHLISKIKIRFYKKRWTSSLVIGFVFVTYIFIFLKYHHELESLVSSWQKKFPNRNCISADTALSSLVQSWNNKPSNWVGFDPCGSEWAGISCDDSRITDLLDLRFIVPFNSLLTFLFFFFQKMNEYEKSAIFSFRKLAGLSLEGQLSSAIQSLSELETLYIFYFSFELMCPLLGWNSSNPNMFKCFSTEYLLKKRF